MTNHLRYVVVAGLLGMLVSPPHAAQARIAERSAVRATNQEAAREQDRAQPKRPRVPRVRPEAETPADPQTPVVDVPTKTSGPVIAADGAVETQMPDGSLRRARPGDCGWTIVRPDGRQTSVACISVPKVNLPLPDDASATWLTAHGNALLEIARKLLGGNAASLDNYLKSVESEQPGVYERIRLRTDLLGKLTAQ